MNKVKVIFVKELKGILFSPGFYFICFLVSVLFSWMFPLSLKAFAEVSANAMFQQNPEMGAQMNIHFGVFLRHLSQLNFMLILIVPLLTMRLFSEEKKMRSFDLLLTSPITSAQIVAGKYLASVVAVLAVSFVALLYPLSTAFFVKFDWASLMTAFFGIVLVGSVYAAMNLFCSAMTDSIILASVSSVILNCAIWFVGAGVEAFDEPSVRSFFEYISLNQHIGNLVEGTVRSSTLVFFGSLIFLFCFLCERVVESSRWRS